MKALILPLKAKKISQNLNKTLFGLWIVVLTNYIVPFKNQTVAPTYKQS
jgi:hypothetical protein